MRKTALGHRSARTRLVACLLVSLCLSACGSPGESGPAPLAGTAETRGDGVSHDCAGGDQACPQSQPRVDIAQYRDGKKAAVSFTFDDGVSDVPLNALPIFDEYGFRTTLYVCPAWVANTPDGWREWKTAAANGHEIGNHTMRHLHLAEVDDDAVTTYEIEAAYEAIEQNIGTPPLTLAFPFGESNPLALQLARERHLAVRDDFYSRPEVRRVSYGSPGFTADEANRAVDNAIANGEWIIAVLHGVEGEGWDPVSHELLAAHLAYVASKKDDLSVQVFSDAAAYALERDHSVLDVAINADDSATMRIDTKADLQVPLIPLAVQIDVTPNTPSTAIAIVRSSGQPLEANIQGSTIVIPAVPFFETIDVQWH